MIKILHIIDSGGLYGAEKVLLALMAEQKKMGLEPILGSIGNTKEGQKPIESEAHSRELRVEVFQMRSGPNWAGGFRMLNFAKKEKIDILHSHGYKGNILFGMLPRRIRGIPLVSTLHGWTWVGGFSRMFFYEWLDRISMRFVDQVVMVHAAMKDHVRIRSFPVNAVEVVENGIGPIDEITGNHLRADILEFASQGFTICAVGRLSTEKGIELLLSVVATVIEEGTDVRLVLLGDGELRSFLQKRSEELGLGDRILLAGYVDNARRYLPFFSALVIPSVKEGLPMVLLEAMAAGTPIVATRVGGMPEVLEHGRAGILTEPGDNDGLKEALVAIIRDVQGAKTRAILAKERVRENYSSCAMAEKYERIYRKLLCRKP
jgi:glycosyltransferase involved in cell wall biosynthesis